MFTLRVLSIRDVLTALKRGEPTLAVRIGHNLCTNAVSTVQRRLRGGAHVSAPRSSRRPV